MFSSERTVHGCQKLDHIVMQCPEKCAPKAKGGESKKSWKKRKKKPGGIHSVEETVTVTVAEPVYKTAWPMLTVLGSQFKELILPVRIGGKPVDLEPDTRASVTILIPNHVFVLAARSLQRNDVQLKSYSGHEIPVLGEAKAQVSYGDQQVCLPVIVTAGDGPALMGRNWLFVHRLD